jgi:hypothetical protein
METFTRGQRWTKIQNDRKGKAEPTLLARQVGDVKQKYHAFKREIYYCYCYCNYYRYHPFEVKLSIELISEYSC